MICEAIFCIIVGGTAIDGDTISPPNAIDPDVRLHGVNAVERYEDGHEEATAALQAMIEDGVACRFVSWTFSRRAMQCWNAEGEDIACELIRQGHVVEDTRYSGGRYEECGHD